MNEPGLSEATPETSDPRFDRAAGLLLVIFAIAYFALGPGNFFSVDEVLLQQTSSGVVTHGSPEVVGMNTSLRGRGDAYYATKGPGLAWCAVPFATLGRTLDRAFGSMSGGPLVGNPIGTPEHPLRWSGRPTISMMLAVNALIGGACVALLFLSGVRLAGDAHAALHMALAAGGATLLASEATHFFQHPLQALGSLLALWFLGSGRLVRGGLALGVTLLSGIESAPLVAVLGVYGFAVGARGASRGSAVSRMSRLALGPALAAMAFLHFNDVRFGSPFRFGYDFHAGRAGFDGLFPVIDAGQLATAFTVYLVGPSNGVLLYSPPLVLLVSSLWTAGKRWPLETRTILAAFVAELALISVYGSWHGALSYGPRFMLAPTLLLMLLTLPAFARRGVATRLTTMAGVAIAGIGIAVYVTTNQWFRATHGIGEHGEFAVVPAASPILVHLRHLLRGEHLAPWGLRAVSEPGPALAIWTLLAAIAAVGAHRLRAIVARWSDGDHRPRAAPSSRLANTILAVIVLFLFTGWLATDPVERTRRERIGVLLSDGIAAQLADRDIEASELYAIVLGLDPDNTFAYYNLGLLAHDAGRSSEAIALYGKTLSLDPGFGPARHNLGLLMAPSPAQSRPHE